MTETQGAEFSTENPQLLDKLSRIPALKEATKPPYVTELLRPLAKQSPWTLDHATRTALITSNIHAHLDSPDDIRVRGERAALLHDVGKADNPLITPEILNKPGALDDSEREAMRTHPKVGYERILNHDPMVAKVMIAHHEFQGDGSYPRAEPHSIDPNLLREQAIIAVADAVDALLNKRPYPKWDEGTDVKPEGGEAWSEEIVIEELERRFSEYLDPEILAFAVKSGAEHAGKKL